MPYLIDGHNLIPKVAGLSLQSLDDEMQLVEMLQEFCRRRKRQVEVYFDNSPPGQPRARNFGAVLARFVREGQTADDAIHARLLRLGRSARNWTVVSSDRMVQASAREAKAQVVSSEDFSALLIQTLSETLPDSEKNSGASLSSEDLEDWLNLFGSDPDSK